MAGAPRRPLVLVGTSLGGATAIDFVLEVGVPVDALVLIDAQAFTDRSYSAVAALPCVASAGAEVLRSRWLRKLANDLAYHDDRFKCEDIMRIGGLHCHQPGWKEATVSFIQHEGYCLSNRVADVRVPTLVLWGQYDRVLPIKDADKFKKAMPDCRVSVVKDSGHSPHIEKPREVVDTIVSFLKELELTLEG